MNNHQIKQVAFKIGVISLLVGAIALALSWNLFNGDLPGYRLFLLPGILFIMPFTEELDFGLKIVLLLGGQFLVSSIFTIFCLRTYMHLVRKNSI